MEAVLLQIKKKIWVSLFVDNSVSLSLFFFFFFFFFGSRFETLGFCKQQ